MNLSVVYWNVAKNPEAIPIALGDHHEFDIVAIQEPSRNRETGRLYCPARCKYYLIYGGSGRAALYVHKRHSVAAWSQDTGEDWCSVTFGSGQEAVTIWSIYSPCEEAGWRSPLNEIAERPPVGRHLLVGDMNLHHPLWDREGRVSTHADALLSLAERWDLELATPWGEPTRRRNTSQRDDRDGTIDHAWYSNTLRVSYEGPLDYAGSDHAAQLVRVVDPANTLRPRSVPRGWTWALMDKTFV